MPKCSTQCAQHKISIDLQHEHVKTILAVNYSTASIIVLVNTFLTNTSFIIISTCKGFNYCISLVSSRGVYKSKVNTNPYKTSEVARIIVLHSLPQKEEETHTSSPPHESTSSTHMESIKINSSLRSNTIFPNKLSMLRKLKR